MALTAEERGYKKAHREQQREYSRKWEAAHPEQALEMKRKACRRYRETHREQVREAQRRWLETHHEYKRKSTGTERYQRLRHKRHEFVQGILAGQVCATCGESVTAKLLFHHTDPSTKRFAVGSGTSYAEASILAEIVKCVVWCRSCHGKFHDTLHTSGRNGTNLALL